MYLRPSLLFRLLLGFGICISFAYGQGFEPFEVHVTDTLHYSPDTDQSLEEFFGTVRDSTYVLIEEGDYYPEYDLEFQGNNIVVEGIGEVNIATRSLESNVIWVWGDKLIFRNLLLTHYRPSHLNYRWCTGRVIFIGDATDVIVENCELNGCGVSGVHDGGANHNILIRNNYIHNNSLAAFSSIGGIAWTDSLGEHHSFTFEGNRLENNGHGKLYDAYQDPMAEGLNLVFPNFKLEFQGFMPQEIERRDAVVEEEGDPFLGQEYIDSWYRGNEEEGELYWEEHEGNLPYGLKVFQDTIHLSEGYDSNPLSPSKINLSTADGTGNFRLSYALRTHFQEVVDYDNTDVPTDYEELYWHEESEFWPIADSSGIFEAPPFWKQDYLDELKIEFQLADTNVTIPGEYPQYIFLRKGQRLIDYTVVEMVLQIEYLQGKQVLDTRFVVIGKMEEY